MEIIDDDSKREAALIGSVGKVAKLVREVVRVAEPTEVLR